VDPVLVWEVKGKVYLNPNGKLSLEDRAAGSYYFFNMGMW